MTTAITPRVSIVLPVRNAAATIDVALRSVFEQTLEDFECLVVDDGSTDGTADRLSEWSDPRLRVLRQPHQGLVPALRRGVAEVRAPYIARLDADDAWEDRTKLAQQVAYLDEHPECVVVGTWFTAAYPDGSTSLVRPPADDRELKRNLLRSATLAHPTVVFRKAAYDAAGGYRDHFGTFAEDLDLWFRMGRNGAFHVLPIVGLRYAVHASARSQANSWRQSLKVVAVGCENLPHIRIYPDLPRGLLKQLRLLLMASAIWFRRVFG